ncbi:MAG: hypothetical protein JSS69_14670 [Acidobacteria bacterium]|nr:hypothetical protein [Acidobacteriota bacterium]MBS1867155.1 hypothetical protein [Acidobacteriota bacterium]
MKVRVTAILLTLIFAAAAYAHGDKVHVMGTLAKVSADAVSVKTADGKMVDVKLASTTIYILRDGKSKDGVAAKFADLAVGQKVIIHATPKGMDLIANEVKFSAASGNAKTKSGGN